MQWKCDDEGAQALKSEQQHLYSSANDGDLGTFSQ
jgi:hypothetical protein